MTEQEINRLFTYHPPKIDQAERYNKLREAAKAYALLIHELTPVSPEQTLAIRHVWFASMCANGGIAVNESL